MDRRGLGTPTNKKILRSNVSYSLNIINIVSRYSFYRFVLAYLNKQEVAFTLGMLPQHIEGQLYLNGSKPSLILSIMKEAS